MVKEAERLTGNSREVWIVGRELYGLNWLPQCLLNLLPHVIATMFLSLLFLVFFFHRLYAGNGMFHGSFEARFSLSSTYFKGYWRFNIVPSSSHLFLSRKICSSEIEAFEITVLEAAIISRLATRVPMSQSYSH